MMISLLWQSFVDSMAFGQKQRLCSIGSIPPGHQIVTSFYAQFIVKFDTVEEKYHALHEGPWFWGNAGLFTTPWFPGFDPSSMVVSKMPVRVRLHNLPLHFWFPNVFEAMGNAIGKYIKQDVERIARCIHTFA